MHTVHATIRCASHDVNTESTFRMRIDSSTWHRKNSALSTPNRHSRHITTIAARHNTCSLTAERRRHVENKVHYITLRRPGGQMPLTQASERVRFRRISFKLSNFETSHKETNTYTDGNAATAVALCDLYTLS